MSLAQIISSFVGKGDKQTYKEYVRERLEIERMIKRGY